MSDVSWSMTVVADGRAVFSTSEGTTHVDGVGTISADIPAGGQDVTLEVFPGAGDLLRLLVLRPSAGSALTIRASDGQNNTGTEFSLEGAQVFAGDIPSLLGAAPNQLIVSNPGQEDASLDAFVARDVN